MGDIKNYNPAEEETLDSREVAEMVEKQHKNLLRDINGYIENMKQGTELKIEPSEFFIPSTYTDSTGRKLPCFLVTTPEELAAADKRATAMLLNAKNRAASFLQKLYDRAGTKPEYQAMALSDFYSEDGIHLPRMAFQDMKQTYDKSAIAEKLGVYSKASGGKVPHAQAIGAIISTLDISEDERERLPYCNNGHDGVDYQYTESVVEKVRAWIEAHGRPSPITVNGKNYAVVYKKE